MRLEDIDVRTEAMPQLLSGNAPVVLREIAALLERLLSGEGAAQIDLSSLPFTEADRAWLSGQLGRGEVEIIIDAGGPSRYLETSYPGVWWVEHRDQTGQLLARLIEVAWVPELLSAQPGECKRGLEDLKNLISGLS